MKKFIPIILVLMLSACETVSDFSMPNLGMPDLSKYNINPFNKNAAEEVVCPKPMILADAISINEFMDFGSFDEANVIYRGRIDRVDYECNVEQGYSLGNLYIIGTISLGQRAMDNNYELPAFIAIVNNKKEVLSRKYIDIDVDIPDGASLARFEYVVNNYRLDFEQSQRSQDYKILVGFKLTADQIEYNKNK